MLAVAVGEYSQPPLPAPWVILLDCLIGLTGCVQLFLLFRPPLRSRRRIVLVLSALLPATVSPLAVPASTAVVLATGRQQPWRRAVGVAVVGVLCHSVRQLWRPTPGLGFGWAVCLFCVAHLALLAWGMRQRVNDQLVESLAARARRAEEDQRHRVEEARRAERHRIAREMHDVLAHRLSLVATWAGALELRTDSDPDQLARAAGVVRKGSHRALADLREVIGLLRDGGEDPQVARHPQPGLADLDALIAETRSAGSDVRVEGTLDPAESVPDGAARTVYRVVQESLTNARKHAPGEPVDIIFSRTPELLVVEVRNRLPAQVPVGPAGSDLPLGSGAGLIGLSERVSLAGGTFRHIESGGAFSVQAEVPSGYDA